MNTALSILVATLLSSLIAVADYLPDGYYPQEKQNLMIKPFLGKWQLVAHHDKSLVNSIVFEFKLDNIIILREKKDSDNWKYWFVDISEEGEKPNPILSMGGGIMKTPLMFRWNFDGDTLYLNHVEADIEAPSKVNQKLSMKLQKLHL